MLMPEERKRLRAEILKRFHERAAKPTGKEPTGLGAGLYCQDFTREVRSAVMDELIRQDEENQNHLG